MHTRPWRIPRGRLLRGRRERGAVAVETAIVSTLLTTILFGVVEVSFLLRDAMVVSSASRAGARMASSMPRVTTAGTESILQVQDALSGVDLTRVSEVWLYQANAASGAPPSSNYSSCSGNCIRYTWSGSTWTATGSNSWLGTLNACEGTQDYVGVYVKYLYPTRIGLFNNKSVTEQTVMRLEPYTGLSACA